MTKITISLIKADVGGYPGHSSVHPALIETAESKLAEAKKAGALTDFRVLACGDDLELLRAASGAIGRRMGETSTLAVLARGVSTPCVVGIPELPTPDPRGIAPWVTVDANNGTVFVGAIAPTEPRRSVLAGCEALIRALAHDTERVTSGDDWAALPLAVQLRVAEVKLRLRQAESALRDDP